MAEVKVKIGAKIYPNSILANRLAFITIKGLKATDGTELSEALSLFYTTRSSPFYSTIMRVRILSGSFLDEVPDYTIAMLVHFFSNEADLLNYLPETAAEDAARYRSYRSRWVTVATIIALISGTGLNSSMQKRLGDFSVKRDRAADELLGKARKDLADLTSFLEDGGNLGRSMETAVKGELAVDRPFIGRLWSSGDRYETEGPPAANTRSIFTNSTGRESRTRRTFRLIRDD